MGPTMKPVRSVRTPRPTPEKVQRTSRPTEKRTPRPTKAKRTKAPKQSKAPKTSRPTKERKIKTPKPTMGGDYGPGDEGNDSGYGNGKMRQTKDSQQEVAVMDVNADTLTGYS